MSEFLTLTSQLSTAVDQLNQVLQGDENTTVMINGEEKPSVQKKALDEVTARVQLVLDAAADIDAVKYGSIQDGVASGSEYFSVVSDQNKTYLDLYKNESGNAVLITSYPSVEGVFNFKGEIASGTNLSSITTQGTYSLEVNGGYTDLPPDFNVGSAAYLAVVGVFDGDRFFHQELRAFNSPKECWVRRTNTEGTPLDWEKVTGTNSIVESSIKNKQVTHLKIADKTIRAGNISDAYLWRGELGNGTSLNTPSEFGTYYLNAAFTYTDLPPDFITGRSAVLILSEVFGTGRFYVEELFYFSGNDMKERWVRKFDVENPTNNNWNKVSGINTIVGSDIKPKEISEEKLADKTITLRSLSENYLWQTELADNASLNSNYEFGEYYLSPSKSYSGTPSDFIDGTSSIFTVKAVLGTNRFYIQELYYFANAKQKWVRRYDNQNPDNNDWILVTGSEAVKRSDIALEAVNTPLLASKSVTRYKLADSFLYNKVLEGVSLNDTDLPDGTYTVLLNVTDKPSELTSSSILEVSHADSFSIQRIVPLNSTKTSFSRIARYTTGFFSKWEKHEQAKMSQLEGKNIAFIGDSITEGGNYAELVCASLGANLFKFGFGGCRMGQHNMSNSLGPYYNEMCMFNIAKAINTGDFTAMAAAAQSVYDGNGDDNRPQVQALSEVDWSTIDYIVVFFGTNDFAGDLPLGSDNDLLSDGTTFKGAMNYAIQQVLTAYPHIRMSFIAPIWRSRIIGGDGLDVDTNPNANGDYLIDFVDSVINVAKLNKIPAKDGYRESGFNKYNFDIYSDDGLHPNDDGDVELAKTVASFLTSKF
jgi:lysophospholipase L1-like esterase